MSHIVPMLLISVASWMPGTLQNLSTACDTRGPSQTSKSPPAVKLAYDHPHGPNPHGRNPHGADPHGDDPHDERHDPELPANKEQDRYKAPKDIYKGEYPPP